MELAVEQFKQLAAQPYIMHARAAIDSLCALSLAYEHLQRPDQADETVRLLLEFARQTNDPTYRTIASSFQARLSLLRGDAASAVRWLRTADLASDAGVMLWWLEVPRLTECRVLVAEGSDASLQQAIDKLEQSEQENKAVHNTCQRVDILSLLALATYRQERADEALAILGRAVALAEPGSFTRPFVDQGPEMATLLQEIVARGVADGSLKPATALYLSQVITEFPEPIADQAAAEPHVPGIQQPEVPRRGEAEGLVEPLTEREMEVLALLARRLTNQEIARELVVAPGTVKAHTHNIYGKLAAGDRRQAVARARSLGLLPPE